MTIFFPDVSNYQGEMTLLPGTVACIAECSEGTGFTDYNFGHFQQQATSVGALFSAFHFMHAGNGAAQGRYAAANCGGAPIMIDCEASTEGGNPNVQDCLDFAAAARAAGRYVWGCYLPEWYWSGTLGQPSLAPLAAAGLVLVASGYPESGYSDDNPNWNPYGGMTPVIWQYTDSLLYNGLNIDFNAYKGTVPQLAQLWGLAHTNPTPPPAAPEIEDDMDYVFYIPPAGPVGGGYAVLLSGQYFVLPDGTDVTGLQAVLKTVTIDQNLHDVLLTKFS